MKDSFDLIGIMSMVILSVVAEAGQTLPHDADTTARLIEGNTKFALRLYRRLAQDGGNTVVSPLSISVASAMVDAGARGDTEAEIAASLEFNVAEKELHPTFGHLLTELEDRVGRWARLTFANGLWVDTEYSLLPGYQTLVSKHYGAATALVDFGESPGQTSEEINGWVAEQTRGKIKSVVRPEMFTDGTTTILVNTVYFLAAWAHSFPADKTKEEEFHLSGGGTVPVAMMHRSGRARYLGDETLEVFELPYQGSGLSMLIVLPSEDLPLAEVEAALTPSAVANWINRLTAHRIDVAVPRFEVNERLNLAPILMELGVRHLFSSDDADLTGMCHKRGAFVGRVDQVVNLGITERGTEAAAATVYRVFLGTQALPQDIPIAFTADRPFMYMIRDMHRGTVLFIGRMVDPSAG